MSFVSDFKAFALKGNVVDLAVGVIIGGAFGKIVSSLVDNVIMPPVGKLLSSAGGDWKSAQIESVGIKYGAFLGSVLDFLIIALVLFVVIVKLVGAFQKPAATVTKTCGECLESIPLAAKKCRACASTQPALT